MLPGARRIAVLQAHDAEQAQGVGLLRLIARSSARVVRAARSEERGVGAARLEGELCAHIVDGGAGRAALGAVPRGLGHPIVSAGEVLLVEVEERLAALGQPCC